MCCVRSAQASRSVNGSCLAQLADGSTSRWRGVVCLGKALGSAQDCRLASRRHRLQDFFSEKRKALVCLSADLSFSIVMILRLAICDGMQ